MSGRAVWKREEMENGVYSICPAYRVENDPPPADKTSGPLRETPECNRYSTLLAGICARLADERQQLLSELRPAVVDLALAVAREIVGEAAACDASVAARQVETALQTLDRSHRVIVFLHPDDVRLIEKHCREKGLDHDWSIELRADQAISRGGCRLESDCSIVDAAIETQLGLIGKGLKYDVVNEQAGDGTGS